MFGVETSSRKPKALSIKSVSVCLKAGGASNRKTRTNASKEIRQHFLSDTRCQGAGGFAVCCS